MKALGINIYGGGFTLGVKQHFKVIGQWEECKLGMKTFDMNFKGIYRPLELAEWPIKQTKHTVDFVFGNPPCTPWSTATGKKGATKENRHFDKRLELTKHTMSAALEIEPTIFISESVENAFNIGIGHYEQYKELWQKKGYMVTYFMNDAIIQEAPCVRRRFHFIASKYNLQLDKEPYIGNIKTVREAIGEIDDMYVPQHDQMNINPDLAKILYKVPPYGLVRETIVASPGYKGTKTSFYARKLAWDYPAPTMVGFGFFHPEEPRWITAREGLRLCGYPDSFIAHNAIEAIDAVLPPVSEFLAYTAKSTIQAREPIKQKFQVIDWRPFAKPHHFNKKNFI